jgi:plastocyanin
MNGRRTSLPPTARWLVAGRRQKAAVVAATVISLAGCSGGGETPPAATSAGPDLGTVTTAADGVQEVTLQTQDDYVFTPSTFTVAPGEVRLTVVNVAEQMTHNFRFTPGDGPAPIDPEIPLLTPGESRTLEFTVTTPGEYGFECSFHTQLQQYGTMTVSG